MTDKFQEGRHSIRSFVMSLSMSRINPALKACQLPNLNAKCFYKNFLGFHYLLNGIFFWTWSFLWRLICLCLILLQFQILRLWPEHLSLFMTKTWLSYLPPSPCSPVFLCFSASKDFRILWDIAETRWFLFFFFFFSQWFSQTLSVTFFCLENRDMNHEWIQPWH